MAEQRQRDEKPAEAPELRRLGTTWARAQKTGVLRVLSAVIPEEYNYLLNPSHRSVATVQVIRRRPFAFDPRLLG